MKVFSSIGTINIVILRLFKCLNIDLQKSFNASLRIILSSIFTLFNCKNLLRIELRGKFDAPATSINFIEELYDLL